MYRKFDRFIFSKRSIEKKNCCTNYSLNITQISFNYLQTNFKHSFPISSKSDPLRKISKPSTYTYIYTYHKFTQSKPNFKPVHNINIPTRYSVKAIRKTWYRFPSPLPVNISSEKWIFCF